MIKEGDYVVLKHDQDKAPKVVQIGKDKKFWMKTVTLKLDGAVGHPYGSLFEVRNKELFRVSRKALKEKTEREAVQRRDNRNLHDIQENQKLSKEDIEAMRKTGATGETIVDKLIENSSTFSAKNEYSQQKYIKKKKQKHTHLITILRPTTRLLAETYYCQKPSKICHLRIDTLSQMLAQGNVRAGSKVLLVETCQGLVLGAIMERLAGHGQIIQIRHGSAPQGPILAGFNFPKEHMAILETFPMDLVNSLQKNSQSVGQDDKTESQSIVGGQESKVKDSSLTPSGHTDQSGDNTDLESTDISENVECSMDCEEGTVDNKDNKDPEEEGNSQSQKIIEGSDQSQQEKETNPADQSQQDTKGTDQPQKSSEGNDQSDQVDSQSKSLENTPLWQGKGQKRKKIVLPEEEIERRRRVRQEKLDHARSIIEKGDMDCLIVACKFYPTPLVMKLLDFLAPSRQFVVHCTQKEPLLDLYHQLRNVRGGVINLRVSETWLRGYQVLQNRTHPDINMNAASGYLLTGTTVLD